MSETKFTPQKEREAQQVRFEAWVNSRWVACDLSKDRSGNYLRDVYFNMFEGWMAALADAEQEVTPVNHGNGNLTGMFNTPMPTANYSVEVSAIMDAGIHEPSGAFSYHCVCICSFGMEHKGAPICGKEFVANESKGNYCRNMTGGEYCNHGIDCHVAGDNGGERV